MATFEAHLKLFKTQLSQQDQEVEAKVRVAREKRDRCEDVLPMEFNFVARTLRGLKAKIVMCVEAGNEYLQNQFLALSIKKAMKLVDLLQDKLNGFRTEKGVAKIASETTVSALRAIAVRFRVESSECAPRKGMPKNRFEYILGVDDAFGEEASYLWRMEDQPLPKVEELRRALSQTNALAPAQAVEIGAEKYAERIFDFVADKCSHLLNHSAVSVLAANRKKALAEGRPDPIPGLMQRSLEKSTLLLPLDLEKLQGQSSSIRDILIIGVGEVDDEPKRRAQKIEENHKLLRDYLPEVEREHTTIAHTEDAYRITITRYKAIFPLGVIRGIEDLRRAYHEHVLPPSHIDREQLFDITDPLPEEPAHVAALKVVSLALMKCFAVEGQDGKPVYVLEHVKLNAGGSYFKPAPELDRICLQSYDDRDKLPGKQGKFYSLVEELSKDYFERMRDGIAAELARRAQASDFLPKFLAEAEEREREFLAIVKGASQGLKDKVMRGPRDFGGPSIKSFNKMITGNYYRREARFFGAIVKNQEFLSAKMKKEGKNLIEILLSTDESFGI